MSKKTEKILQEIIDLDGNCLSDSRCRNCPFKSKCLTEFTSRRPPSKKRRAAMALDTLAALALEDDLEWRKNHD